MESGEFNTSCKSTGCISCISCIFQYKKKAEHLGESAHLQSLGNDETALGSTEKGKGLCQGLCLWEGRSRKVRNDQVRIRGGLEASPEGRESFVKLCP